MKQRPELDRQKSINTTNTQVKLISELEKHSYFFRPSFHLIKHAIELLEGSMRVEPIPEECIPVECWELSMSEPVQQQLSRL
jgi:hypothetical protein